MIRVIDVEPIGASLTHFRATSDSSYWTGWDSAEDYVGADGQDRGRDTPNVFLPLDQGHITLDSWPQESKDEKGGAIIGWGAGLYPTLWEWVVGVTECRFDSETEEAEEEATDDWDEEAEGMRKEDFEGEY